MAKKITNQMAQEGAPVASIVEVVAKGDVAVSDIEEGELPAVTSQVNRIIEAPKEVAIEYKKEEPGSTEEKIVGFLKDRNIGGFVPIADFLKSLYPPVVGNGAKAWHDQRAMKALRNTLEEMVKSRQIIIEGDSHRRLSKFYYPDASTGITHYYNLDTLLLKAKLA